MWKRVQIPWIFRDYVGTRTESLIERDTIDSAVSFVNSANLVVLDRKRLRLSWKRCFAEIISNERNFFFFSFVSFNAFVVRLFTRISSNEIKHRFVKVIHLAYQSITKQQTRGILLETLIYKFDKKNHRGTAVYSCIEFRVVQWSSVTRMR